MNKWMLIKVKWHIGGHTASKFQCKPCCSLTNYAVREGSRVCYDQSKDNLEFKSAI